MNIRCEPQSADLQNATRFASGNLEGPVAAGAYTLIRAI
jgi:hypothetical protein